MVTVTDCLHALENPHGLFRRLRDVELWREQGRPWFRVGNNAVVVSITHAKERKLLRCYFRPHRNLRAIYGDNYYAQELFIPTPVGECSERADVVLVPWVEGMGLDFIIEQTAERGDSLRLQRLAACFDRLALQLVTDDWAHGDLKPANIIVTADDRLELIDFDALYKPEFDSKQAEEAGTPSFQHPARTEEMFNRHMDDYPAALIATALHALALDPTLYARFPAEGLLYDPHHIADDAAWRASLRLFARAGAAAEYRLARLLCSPYPQLDALPALLGYLVTSSESATPTDAPTTEVTFYREAGLWGLCTGEGRITPPLYDEVFDFVDDRAAVMLGESLYHIDRSGRRVMSPSDASFSDNRTTRELED